MKNNTIEIQTWERSDLESAECLTCEEFNTSVPATGKAWGMRVLLAELPQVFARDMFFVHLLQ
jgi:hypothetical protein